MASDVSFSWRRSVAWALSLAVHLAFVVAMTLPSEPAAPASIVAQAAAPAWLPVDLPDLRRDAPSSTPAEPVPERVPAGEARQPSVRDRVPRRVDAMDRRALPNRAELATPVARTTVFLDSDARALLPQEDLYAATPPPRDGDYYAPGNGSEDDVFYRPIALDPAPSRFARVWTESRGTVVDAWLGKVLEKATGTVSIPLNQKFNLVCGTVAGLVGSCTIVRDGGTGVIVQRPPPAPWERSNRVQCRELRDALDGADDAAQAAYYLDRLSALCSTDDVTTPATGIGPGSAARNDEARREAGLPEDRRASGDAVVDPQRDL
jgi:hypothetical protein